MLLEVAIYEGITTVATWFGFKVLSGDTLNRRMATISTKRHLPLLDNHLRRRLGIISKSEAYLSTKVANGLSKISKYEAFRLLLIHGWRQFDEARRARR